MVKDQQVRRLFMYKKKEKYQYQAADKAGMTERTAYKYIKAENIFAILHTNGYVIMSIC